MPNLLNCRECAKEVSRDALMCPHCGAPRPYEKEWTGFGFEYRTRAELWGLPLLHVCFKYRHFRPRIARGVIAVGQFGVGIVTIAQFGVGVFTLAQFALGALAVCQIGFAVRALGQIVVVLDRGIGQIVVPLWDQILRLF